MSNKAIQAQNVGKQYFIGGKQEKYRSVRESITNGFVAPFRRAEKLFGGQATGAAELNKAFWALREVSFEIKPGEILGIIGRNGAGKSTLLKILSRITEPTEGIVEISGRVGSLLEVGTGFHPELTGRENIFLNGSILGMKRSEIDDKFDEIVAFAEVEKFIDTPVKHYSTGMYLRLAFSVAAHLESEILLVDEVLAVGDAYFQKKCIGRMENAAQTGRTVLFVSHNMAAIENLCSRVLLIEAGQVKMDASPDKAIPEYLGSFSNSQDDDSLSTVKRDPGLIPIIQEIEFIDKNKQLLNVVQTGCPLTIRIHYKHCNALSQVRFGLTFETPSGMDLFWLQTEINMGYLLDLPSSGTISCHVPRIPLVPGLYFLSVGCGNPEKQLDFVRRACRLQVTNGDFYGTGRLPNPRHVNVQFLVDAKWNVKIS